MRKFYLNISSKKDLVGLSKYIITSNHEIYLRVIQNVQGFLVMTPTAVDDRSFYSVHDNLEKIMKSAVMTAEFYNIQPVKKRDFRGRDYVEICVCENLDIVTETVRKFFDIFDNHLSGEEFIENKPRRYMGSNLYNELGIGDGEDVYLSDGVYLRSDGSMYEN